MPATIRISSPSYCVRSSRSGTRGRGFRAALVVLALLGVGASLHAFSFEPITQTYTTTGPGASHVFRVTNTTDERIAVRISVRSRTIERDGTEVLGKEADDFIVFPRQMLLEPGERRSIRVRWSGPETIDAERPYRIIAEQVPVDLGDEEPTQGGGIRLTYRYEGSLYVSPPGAEPNVEVTSVVRVADGLRVTVANRGTRHVILQNARLVVSGTSGPDIELESEQLVGLAGENMLAGAVRDVVIPTPENLPPGELAATIEFDDT